MWPCDPLQHHLTLLSPTCTPTTGILQFLKPWPFLSALHRSFICWGSLASLLALPPPTQSQPSLPLTASLLFKHPFCRESSPAAQSGLPYFLTPVCSSKYLPQVSSQHCAHLELVTICFMHLPQCTALSPTRARPISILFTTILLYISFPGSRNTKISKKNEHN